MFVNGDFFCGFESHGIHHHEKPAKFEEHVFFNKSALIFVFAGVFFFRIRFHGIHRHLAPPFVLQEYVWVTFFQTTQPANLSKRCITKNYVTSNTPLVGEENSKPPESGFCGEFSVNPPVVVSSGTFMTISHVKIVIKSRW